MGRSDRGAGGTRGGVAHHEWLAQGAGDPRAPIAEALIEACGSEEIVVAYNAGFEKRCIERLAAGLPDLAAPLLAIAGRLVDLLPIVRNHVYDPAFEATLGLARLLLTTDVLDAEERQRLRGQLLAYCERDTWCLVRLLDRLRELAS